MICRVCEGRKTSKEFPQSVRSAALVGTVFNFPCNQLIFSCLHCLSTNADLLEGLKSGSLNDPNLQTLSDEVTQWKQSRTRVSHKLHMAIDSHSIKISLLMTQYLMQITIETTVKDVKLHLSRLQNGRDPRSYRILYNGKELHVKNGNAHNRLIDCGVMKGAQLEAIVSISCYAGQSCINALGVDGFGNAVGNEADLGLDGGFKGLTIAVLKMDRFSFKNTETALTEMGFIVHLWNVEIPDLASFQQILNTADQLWVISSDIGLPLTHVDAICQFFQNGGALYIWGDNDPLNASINPILARVMPGVQLNENYYGCKHLTLRNKGTLGPGFEPHNIFTGITNLYEGYTIARFIGHNARLSYIMNSSEGGRALGICDDQLGGCGRIAIDVAFTRLCIEWDGAGTKRFVKNITAWLCGLDSDWM